MSLNGVTKEVLKENWTAQETTLSLNDNIPTCLWQWQFAEIHTAISNFQLDIYVNFLNQNYMLPCFAISHIIHS